jgi:hypothetical protein
MCNEDSTRAGKAESKSTKIENSNEDKDKEKEPKKARQNKRKAVNCSYIQPAVSRESSNADRNANEEQHKAYSKGQISLKRGEVMVTALPMERCKQREKE